MDFLGEIPLDITIRETSDSGHPIVDHTPDGDHAKAYKAIAAAVWTKACEKLESRAAKMPKIVQ